MSSRPGSPAPAAARPLEARLRRLGPDARRALVADLWTARGYEVRRDDGAVIATRRGRSLVLAPLAGRLWPRVDAPRPAAVDVVVAPRAGRLARAALPAKARLLDATDLAEILRYGLDRPVADRIAREHLGGPLAALSPPPADRLRRGLAAAGGLPALAAVVLLVTAAVGATAIDTGTDRGVTFATDAPTATGPPPATAAAATDGGATPAAGTAWPSGVPGLGPDGITDVGALATVHERAAAGRNYTLWLDYRGPADYDPGEARVHRDTDLRVAGERYTVVETVEATDRRTVRSIYHDGTDWYVADGRGENASYRVVRAANATASVGASPDTVRRVLVRRFLATPSSRVEAVDGPDGRVRYRVVGVGTPDGVAFGGVRNYTVTAVIDGDGLVRDLRARYDLVSGDRTAAVTVEATYGRLGTTTVPEPDWVRAATASSAPAGDGGARTETATATANATDP